MKAGTLTHRVEIQRPVDTGRSAVGDALTEFEPAMTVYARVSPLRGRELIRRGTVEPQVKYELDTEIFVRWSEAVDRVQSGWRIKFGEKLFSVLSVVHIDMARDTVQFLCNSGVKEA